jgi:porin
MQGQDEAKAEAEAEAEVQTGATETPDTDAMQGQDEAEAEAEADGALGSSKSGYVETVPSAGGAKSVDSELIANNRRNHPIFDVDWIHKLLPAHYNNKKKINQKTGIAYSIDYTLLAQNASHSTVDQDGASSVFRIYGNWLAMGDKAGMSGNLVFKFEHRGTILGYQAPRDLGFTTGSALSTANYKDSGWGFTDLYWKQLFNGGRSGIMLGHMDPGDWADQHVLLNAWTNLLNDSFYNNPTEAIPKRTFSLVGRLGLPRNWYAGAGVHDANGKDNEVDFRQVWNTPELFTWVELGFRANDDVAFGETTHLHYWHQDERVEAGVEDSWGITFSSSKVLASRFTTVLRIGYSEGNAAQMSRFIGVAASMVVRGSDHLLAGLSYGSAPDRSLGSQSTAEVLYKMQLTQNMTISPNIQLTFNPVFNDQKSTIYVLGIRARLKF